MKKRTRAILFVAGVLAAMLLVSYRLTMPGLLFLTRFMSPEGEDDFEEITTKRRKIEGQGKSIPVRIYRPTGSPEGTILVVHGVHHEGYNEPRLVRFANQLALLGYTVVTPEIRDLKNYTIQYQAVEEIRASVEWTLDDSGLMQSGKRLKLFGLSFAGGLCISVASQTDIRDRIDSIFSFGGHGNLDRVMRFLATGTLPNQTRMLPHIYGQAVLARQLASRIVPPKDVVLFRKVMLDYLKGQTDAVRQSMEELSPQARNIVQLCLARKSKKMIHILKRAVILQRSHVALSPLRLPRPHAPLYLLHGADDNVIPPFESVDLHQWASVEVKARLLVTHLIDHVELDEKPETSFSEYWDIIRFFTELLR